MSKIEEGDEVIVKGEILYVEKKAKKKWLNVLRSKDTLWQCYDGYGEDRVVKESDMTVKEHLYNNSMSSKDIERIWDYIDTNSKHEG